MKLTITLILSCLTAYYCAYIGNSYEAMELQQSEPKTPYIEECIDTVRMYTQKNCTIKTTHTDKSRTSSKFVFILVR